MTVWTYVTIVYAIGFLVAPFVWSLIDGWPFAEPRINRCEGGTAFFLGLFWPVIIVGWGLFVWWVLCSSAGAKAHEALKRKLEKVARDD